eukprot:164570-Rhodomonas_salina.2
MTPVSPGPSRHSKKKHSGIPHWSTAMSRSSIALTQASHSGCAHHPTASGVTFGGSPVKVNFGDRDRGTWAHADEGLELLEELL